MSLLQLTNELLSSTYVIQVLDKNIDVDDMDITLIDSVEEKLSKGLTLINESMELLSKEITENPSKFKMKEGLTLNNNTINNELSNLSKGNDTTD